MNKLVGRRVEVIHYWGHCVKNYIGKVGIIAEVKPEYSLEFTIQVAFQQGKHTSTELFHQNELRYLNNRPVLLEKDNEN